MMHNWLLYIDPGSGSYLVQVLIAAVLGVGFFFRNLRTYVKSIFSRSEKTPTDNHPSA
jgi:hypothetical protein